MKKRFYSICLLSGASFLGLAFTSIGNVAHNSAKEFDGANFHKDIAKTHIAHQQYVYEMGQYNNARPQKHNVIYVSRGGAEFERSGGSRAWRNNNPGCIRGGEFARSQGAIGNAGGFAVFPDEQTGMNAICALLRTEKYRNKTIAAAVAAYAPTFENNTAAYKRYLQSLTGISLNTRLCDLTDAQLLNVSYAIKQIEGWTPGIETQIRQDTIAKMLYQKVRQ